ncbi:MAG TPA: HlyD family efflux transporter periplasmic adaptor subunit, partial [Planctomycetota bacterium]|nr:HlyD family efflux transporter periplasmic adaptor subunit [Planctomycetota bacterium]
RQTWTDLHDGYGGLRYLRTLSLASEAAGLVQTMEESLQVGVAVPPKTTLVTLDNRDQTHALAQTQGELRQAEVRRAKVLQSIETLEGRLRWTVEETALLTAELDRLRELSKTNSGTLSALDQQAALVARTQRAVLEIEGGLVSARLELKESDEAIALARLAISKIEVDLSRTQIVAPDWASVVLSKAVERGQRLSVGQEVLRLADPSRLEVTLKLRASAFEDVAVGAVVTLRRDRAGPVLLRTVVKRKDQAVDSQEQTFSVYCELDATETSLAAGQFVLGEVEGRKFESVFALGRSGLAGKRAVVVGTTPQTPTEGLAEWRELEVIHELPDLVLVRDGLEEGEIVVTSDPRGIAPRQRLRVQASESVGASR